MAFSFQLRCDLIMPIGVSNEWRTGLLAAWKQQFLKQTLVFFSFFTNQRRTSKLLVREEKFSVVQHEPHEAMKLTCFLLDERFPNKQQTLQRRDVSDVYNVQQVTTEQLLKS